MVGILSRNEAGLRWCCEPLDSETGVPTETLYLATLAGDGQSIEDVARWFEVPIEAVQAAIEYERHPEAA